MIHRYAQTEKTELWSDLSKFQLYVDLECDYLAIVTSTPKLQLTLEPQHVVEIQTIEQTTRHEMCAVIDWMKSKIPSHLHPYLHYGLTSSDILETAQSIQIKKALQLIYPQIHQLQSQLKNLALENQDLIGLARTHGKYAIPMSYGLKFLRFYAGFERHSNQLHHLETSQLTGKIAGPVGSYALINPEHETTLLQHYHLTPEPIASQIIPRDRLCRIVLEMIVGITQIESLATEIRLAQFSGNEEMAESFESQQRGSSAMPHKQNPIRCENLVGLAKMARSYATLALENITLWNERDMSHSSNERIYLPDLFHLALYSFKKMNEILSQLNIHREHIQKKVQEHPETSQYYQQSLQKLTTLPPHLSFNIISERVLKKGHSL
jgi:adenylosuccinate lyase